MNKSTAPALPITSVSNDNQGGNKQLVYKLVYKDSRIVPYRFVSAFSYRDILEYKIDVETKPSLGYGPVFAFDKLTNIRKFWFSSELSSTDFGILTCFTYRTLDHVNISKLYYDLNYDEFVNKQLPMRQYPSNINMWKLNNEFDSFITMPITDLQVPDGTIFCESVTPIDIVNTDDINFYPTLH